MPIPTTPYTGAQYLYDGFSGAGDAILRARLQQQQLAQQQAAEQQRLALGYYTADQANARDYYGLDLRSQEMADNRDSKMQARQDALDEKKREADARYDPSRVQPVPLTDGQGNPIPGYYGIPMTGQIFHPDTGGDAAPAPALGSDPTGTGNYFWDGRSLKPTNQGNKLPASAVPQIEAQVSQISTNNAQIQAIQNEMAQHQQEIAKGNNRYGFLYAFSRADRIKDLQQQQQELLQGNAQAQQTIDQIKSAVGGGVRAPAQAVPLNPPLPQGPGQAAPTLPLMAPAPTPAQASGGAPTADSIANPPTALPGAKVLDAQTAQQFLQQAGGDKDKARAMARAAGYSF